ncbi:Flp pilus assembly protein CpaB [Thalassovita sp.]|jgi:pilus assembly protein CpaB|uniref:Flp pilus assembly protein CpaB n=1 Tax=Thalassovita sp. TaxID=1979401 RepID=UPI003B597EBF
MRAVFGLVLVAGLALAGFAVYMAKNYISGYQNELAAANAAKAQIIQTVEVIVAKRPLRYGEVLKTEDVRWAKWPEDSLPEGVFKAVDDLFPDPKNPDMRRIVLRAMEPNEAVMAIKVTEPGEDAGLTSRLKKGMRAFTIKVDVATGVSGFLRPGDVVDVYWTGEIGTGTRNDRREVTKLIQPNIQLIAVDQTANGDDAEATIARTVTVTANSQQVAALAQAQASGRLSLALVGAEDDTVAQSVEVDMRSLLGIKEAEQIKEEQVAQSEKVCTIRNRRGSEVVQIPIPCTN